MKKIYKIELDSDIGEIWIGENKEFLSYIHANDAHFRSEYHSFIIEYLGGELIKLNATDLLNDKEYDIMEEYGMEGDGEGMYKILKKKIKDDK